MLTLARDTVVAGRYRVLGKIGRGGMGVVYLAEHVVTGEKLALKMLVSSDEGASFDMPTLERFKREARASARIQSEHVVRVIDADTASDLGGAPFLVMELLEGSDLERVLGTGGKLAPEQALGVLTQAARGLDASHAVGIVHRDLKPSNLFLHRKRDGSAIVKVVDFGLSKMIDEAAIAKATQTGAVMGTPMYMSPEQARGRTSEISAATDVWAMGLIAVHLLTGDVYWRATAIGELVTEIVVEPLYPPSSRWEFLPPAFDEWFYKSCARHPKERFGSVGEQIAALARALDCTEATLTESGTTQVAPRTASLPDFAIVSMRPLPEREELEAPLAATVATPRSPIGPNTPISVGHGTVDHFAATMASTGGSQTAARSKRPLVVGLIALGALVGATSLVWKLRASDPPRVIAATEPTPTPPAASGGPVARPPASEATSTLPEPSTSAPVETGAGSAALAASAVPSAKPRAIPPRAPPPKPSAAAPAPSAKTNAPFNPIAP